MVLIKRIIHGYVVVATLENTEVRSVSVVSGTPRYRPLKITEYARYLSGLASRSTRVRPPVPASRNTGIRPVPPGTSISKLRGTLGTSRCRPLEIPGYARSPRYRPLEILVPSTYHTIPSRPAQFMVQLRVINSYW